MRSTFHLTFTFLITLFAAHQTYQLQQVNEKTAIIEVKPQTDFHFASIQPECNTTAAIGVNNMNVLTEEIYNPISVAMTGVPSEKLEISIDNGEVISYNDGHFVLNNIKKGKATVTIKGKNDVGEVCSYRHPFRVKEFPIVPRLGNKSGGIIGRREMSLQRGVIAVAPEFSGDIKINIVGFKTTLIRDGKSHQSAYTEGAPFSNEASKLIKQAQVGDFYLFRNIKVKNIDGSIRTLDNMLFEIQ